MFVFGNPISPEQFVGRAREVRKVLSRIAFHGQSTAIVGQPRSGKTSLLTYLASGLGQEELARVATSPLRVGFAYLDAYEFAGRLTLAEFWSRVFESLRPWIETNASELSTDIAECRKELGVRAVEALLGRFRARGVRVVLMIDEFDVLVHHAVAEPAFFFGALRSLATRSQGALALVVATRSPLDALEVAARGGGYAGSPYFNFFDPLYIGPLSTEDVDAILARATPSFSAEDRAYIHDLSGGHPYLVQAAASALWSAHAEDGEAAARRRIVESSLIREAAATFGDIWRRLPVAERLVFAAVAIEHWAGLEGHALPRPARSDGSPLLDVEAFRVEFEVLAEQGLIRAGAATPSRYAVRPLAFLTWHSTELRREAASERRWAAWFENQGWESALTRAERNVWTSVVVQLLRRGEASGGDVPLASETGAPHARAGSAVSESSTLREQRVLRYLHLTDWHAGQLSQGWLWPNVRDAFLEDLARVRAILGGVDVVFFTGDLTQRGTRADFDVLDRELDLLWSQFADLGDDPLLIAVPGNHDLVRPARTSAVVKALAGWHRDSEIADAFWSEPKGDYRRCISGAFECYERWTERQPAMKRFVRRPGALPGDFAGTLERQDLRIGVVGLNTAFLQLTDERYREKLDIDVRQLTSACGGDVPGWLKSNDLNLLLTHHPPGWLEPARLRDHFETEIAPPGRFGLHLFGHMHEPSTRSESVGGGRPRHRVQGRSLFGLEWIRRADRTQISRLHGYFAGSIDVELEASKPRVRARLWPRSLVKKLSGERVMEQDTNFTVESDGSLSLDLSNVRSR